MYKNYAGLRYFYFSTTSETCAANENDIQCALSAFFFFQPSSCFFLKEVGRLPCSVVRRESQHRSRRQEATSGHAAFLPQLLIDIERAAGEERARPLLANLCFNQRV